MKKGKKRAPATTIAEKVCRRRRRRHSQDERFFEQNARKIIVINFNSRISLILLSVFSCHAYAVQTHIHSAYAGTHTALVLILSVFLRSYIVTTWYVRIYSYSRVYVYCVFDIQFNVALFFPQKRDGGDA